MPTGQSPLVSVCVPAYMAAGTLPATIESVLSQTLADLELVIIDNHSSDKTAEVVAGFADPRLRFLRNPENIGAEGNWNRCLQEARGRYVKLLPADDVLHPTALQRQVEVLQRDTREEVALVFGARNIINSQGAVQMRRGFPGGREGRMSRERIMRMCVRLGMNHIGEPGGVLIRKSLTERVGSFDGSIQYLIDLDYWLRLLEHGEAYYLAGEPVVGFRIHAASWSVSIGRRQAAEYRRFIDKLGTRPGTVPSRFDRVAGKLMTRVASMLRRIIYRRTLQQVSP